jgi:hypothetical protein
MRLRRTRAPRSSRIGLPAPPISGQDLTGDDVLYFLTSSCEQCRGVWAALGAGAPGVAITPDAETENPRKLRRLAAPGVRVVMSSEAWFAYGAGPAPWKVVVERGVIVAEGPAV